MKYSKSLLAIVSLVLFTACGGGGNTNDTTPGQTTPGGTIPNDSIPLADAGQNQDTGINEVVILDGSNSSTSNSTKLTYAWSIINKPIDSEATLNDTSMINPNFTVDKLGTYRIRLIVNNGITDSEPSYVYVNATYKTTYVSSTPELRIALSRATANGMDDKIILANGHYKTTDDSSGSFIYSDIEPYNLTIMGSNSNNVSISGDNTDLILALKSSNSSARFTIEKITLKEGSYHALSVRNHVDIKDCNISNNNSNRGSYGFGAGVYAYSSLNIVNSIFSNNYAPQYGGAVYTTSKGYSLKIINSTFINNSSSYGGAVVSNMNCEVKNSIFLNNKSSTGAGIYVGGDSSISVTNSIFDTNIGAGIYMWSINTSSISNSIFINNSTGIYLREYENLITNTAFVENDYDLSGAYTEAILKNNYIDVEKLTLDYTGYDNIFYDTTLGLEDKENNNYRILAESDLIDAGTGQFSIIDLDNNPRVSGSTVDIGPYEYQQ